VAAAVGSGDLFRRVLLLVLTAVWGLRLAGFLYVKSKGEDPRYRDLLRGDFSAGTVTRKVFHRAGHRQLVHLAAPATFGRARPDARRDVAGDDRWRGPVGDRVDLRGGGRSPAAGFKADPTNTAAIMDRGLWLWTRHPNYFGDATVWWGLWLVAIAGWVSFVTVFSPLRMTYFLVYVAGARLTEKYIQEPSGVWRIACDLFRPSAAQSTPRPLSSPVVKGSKQSPVAPRHRQPCRRVRSPAAG
jgi:hypothetical protein